MLRRVAAGIASISASAYNLNEQPAAADGNIGGISRESSVTATSDRFTSSPSEQQEQDIKSTSSSSAHSVEEIYTGKADHESKCDVSSVMRTCLDDYVPMMNSQKALIRLGSQIAANSSRYRKAPRDFIPESTNLVLSQMKDRAIPVEKEWNMHTEIRSMLDDKALMDEVLESLRGGGDGGNQQYNLEHSGKWVVREEYKCALCWDMMVCPFNLACGHSFCGECLEDYLQQKERVDVVCCPSCRDPIPHNDCGQLERLLDDVILDYVQSLEASAEQVQWMKRHRKYRSLLNAKRFERLREREGSVFLHTALSVVVVILVATVMIFTKGRHAF